MSLYDLPTIKNTNSKEELALLRNFFHDEEEYKESQPKGLVETTSTEKKWSDMKVVLIATLLYIALSNIVTTKVIGALTGNSIITYIVTVLLFAVIFYVIYAFM